MTYQTIRVIDQYSIYLAKRFSGVNITVKYGESIIMDSFTAVRKIGDLDTVDETKLLRTLQHIWAASMLGFEHADQILESWDKLFDLLETI